MNYRIEVEIPAERDIRRLPPAGQGEIYGIHLPRILVDPEVVGERLPGDLAGNWSSHFGHRPEYRILYTVTGDLIAVWLVGSREEVYKKAKRRLS